MFVLNDVFVFAHIDHPIGPFLLAGFIDCHYQASSRLRRFLSAIEMFQQLIPRAGESDTIRERFARDCRPTRANIGGPYAKSEKEQGRTAN